jgi:hypothetical protein
VDISEAEEGGAWSTVGLVVQNKEMAESSSITMGKGHINRAEDRAEEL